MLRRGQYGLASCLCGAWDPHKTNPAAVNPMYCKGKGAQKRQNTGNHIRASLGLSANEDLKGKKNHQETYSSSDFSDCYSANELVVNLEIQLSCGHGKAQMEGQEA